MNIYKIKAPDEWFQEQINKEGVFDKKSFCKMMEYVADFDLALDIGAHCGSWAVPMSDYFKTIYAFEPNPVNFEYLQKNRKDNIVCLKAAVGNVSGRCGIEKGKRNSGQSHVAPKGNIPMITVDSLNVSPDLIKIDVEGYEYFVLLGAVETIKRSLPVICLEENGLSQRYNVKFKQITDFMQKMGYVLADKVKYDYIFTHNSLV